ncbi:MAG: PilZ domain-containing protein [Phycisphaeraceae bacterium]|nr:PilZ domain-containing protein [Phycisphaeraceae bacterium]
MNTNRSRTERWRECLNQIRDRGGSLEISVDLADTQSTANLVWRVRLMEINDDRLVLEQPVALGQTMRIEPGLRLVVAMSIGQNRWMFRTMSVSSPAGDLRGHLHIASPTLVERCQRRDFYRATTAGFSLPLVQGWKLLDPQTAVAAEVASRIPFEDANVSVRTPGRGLESPIALMPDVAGAFQGQLVNVGGGGAGLLVPPASRPSFDSSGRYWLRMSLGSDMPGPLAVTARCVHQHLDSTQNLHLGFAFDFTQHADHREFIIRQITGYVERVTGMQRNLQAG